MLVGYIFGYMDGLMNCSSLVLLRPYVKTGDEIMTSKNSFLVCDFVFHISILNAV